MLNKKVKGILFVVVGVVLCSGVAFSDIYENAGTTGASFLKFTPGAREGAMGDAFSSVSGDAFSQCWNPALICGVNSNVFSFMHSFWVENVFMDYAATIIPLEVGNLGFSFGYLNAGAIEKTDNSGTSLSGSFNPYDIILGASFARDIIKDLAVGCTFKGIYSDIDSTPAFSYAFDIGTTYSLLKDSLRLGLSIQNLGSSMKFVSQEDPMPFTIRAGGSYKFNSFLISFDTVIPNDADLSIHTGLEYDMKATDKLNVLLRAGYNSKISSLSGISGLSIGAGIKTNDYAIDYAWIPYGVLGNTHRLSMNLMF